MANSNESIVNVFLYQDYVKLKLDGSTKTKLVAVILITLFSVYVNCIMLCSLSSKRAYRESPRYILFGHMLFNDSVHLVLTCLLFVLAVAFLKLDKTVCSLLIYLSTATFHNAPFNLALMSLERYVSICFPLRHAEIVTRGRTFSAIGSIWFLASVSVLIDIIFATVMDPNYFYVQMHCTHDQLFLQSWQPSVYHGFNIFYFVSVTVIIIFTYISIVVTAKSASANKESAKKAHRTVLLHFIQLGLCLTSFLYDIIERTMYLMTSNRLLFIELKYLNFLIVLLLPRCLSPVIYGLRDDAVRPLFKYYFCCGPIKRVR